MKNRMFTLLAVLFIVPMAFALIGCGSSGGGGGGGKKPVYIAVSSVDTTIGVATTTQFTATAYYADCTDSKNVTNSVSWSSTVTDAATIVSKGQATGVAKGYTIVIAKLRGTEGSSVLEVDTVDSLAVTPDTGGGIYVPVGYTDTFTAELGLTDGGTMDVTDVATWSTTVAVATIDAGVATGVTDGTSDINASYLGKTDAIASVLTVEDITADSLDVLPDTGGGILVALGTAQAFTATVDTANLTNFDVTADAAWTAVTAGGTADISAGTAIGTAIGDVTVNATLGAETDATASVATVEVVTSILGGCADATIAVGDTTSCGAIATSAGDTGLIATPYITWEADLADATIDNSGDVLGVTGIAAGTTVTFTVTDVDSGNDDATATVDVEPAFSLESIAIDVAGGTIVNGGAFDYTATGTYGNGGGLADRTDDVTEDVTWTSATVATATISNATCGIGEAESVGTGTSLITATLGLLTDTDTLTVENLLSIAVLPADPTIVLGASVSMIEVFTAEGTLTGSDTLDLTDYSLWESTAAIANVTISNVQGTMGVATGLVADDSDITATSLEGKTSPVQVLTVN